jgi:hypothetical protein
VGGSDELYPCLDEDFTQKREGAKEGEELTTQATSLSNQFISYY